MPFDTALLLPLQDGVRGDLGALVLPLQTGPIGMRIFGYTSEARGVPGCRRSDSLMSRLRSRSGRRTPARVSARPAGRWTCRAPRLPLEEGLCGDGRIVDPSPEAARGREHASEEDRCRSDAGSGDAAGRHPPKALRPARKRQLVDGMLVDWGVSIRPACRAVRFNTST